MKLQVELVKYNRPWENIFSECFHMHMDQNLISEPNEIETIYVDHLPSGLDLNPILNWIDDISFI